MRHLLAFLNKYNLINEGQSGFRQLHSCQTALVKIIDNWLGNINAGELTGAIFYDLRKAFDLVDFQLLLDKLKIYKFSDKAIEFFNSYLTGRVQTVVINNSVSEPRPVKMGVPQGSVLGPVLFLMFINDLPLYINDCSTDLFADDTTVHTHDTNVDIIKQKLQSANNTVLNWCVNNDMLLNAEKSSVMLIGTRNRLAQVSDINLYIDNKTVTNVTQQRLLGVTIDNKLTWNLQIHEMVTQISRKLTLMQLLSSYVSRDCLIKYYNAYIVPLFDYGCLVWGGTNSSNILQIEKLQKRAARIILKTGITTPSFIMFKNLSWLPIRCRIKYHILLLTYKALHNLAPVYITSIFKELTYSNERQLRSISNGNLLVPKFNTVLYSKSFTVVAPNLWNSLPLSIKACKTVTSFKRHVKKYLLDNM